MARWELRFSKLTDKASEANFKGRNMEITGTLKNATWANNHNAPNICGEIYGDTKGRFPDGSIIYTSTVLADCGNGIYRTRFSAYKVEFANEKGRPTSFPIESV